MALMSIADGLEFESDLCAVKAEVRAGVTEDYSKRKDSYLKIWESYCHKTRVDPFLLNVPFLRSSKEDYKMVDLPPTVYRLDLKQFQITSHRWVRGSPTWVPMIHI